MPDVFISYSSEDRTRIRSIADTLEQMGLSVWWDRTIAGGDEYAAANRSALEAARAIIVAWSVNSASSPWVQEEAVYARRTEKLVAIAFDGSQSADEAIDFSAWTGAAAAPEMIALRTRIEGCMAGRKARWLARWQKIPPRAKLFSAIAAFALTFVGVGALLIHASIAQRAVESASESSLRLTRLIRLADEGRINGELAVELADRLQPLAFADAQRLSAAQLASAGAIFSDAAGQLLQDPRAAVRRATLKAANPAAREAGLSVLLEAAQKGGPSAGALYRYCGALAVVIGDQRALPALEQARDLNPQDREVWRLLGFEYDRRRDDKPAEAARLVADGLQLAAESQPDAGAAALDRALPLLGAAKARAFVLGQLGDAAARRDDWAAAERRYRGALEVYAQGRDIAALAIEAPKLARAQLKQGESTRACATLANARKLGVRMAEEQAARICAPSP